MRGTAVTAPGSRTSFDEFIADELAAAIRQDCNTPDIEIITAGASIGAFNAVATLCRHPEIFKIAIGMSGTYDLTRWLDGEWSDDFYFASPMHYLPNLDGGPQLDQLRRRFILLATGEGAMGSAARELADGRHPRRQGNPQPRRPLGPGLRPQLADLARDAAEVPRRADVGQRGDALGPDD